MTEEKANRLVERAIAEEIESVLNQKTESSIPNGRKTPKSACMPCGKTNRNQSETIEVP